MQPSKLNGRFVVGALVILGLILLNPLYRYDEVKTASYTYPVRVNRFTGDAALLTPDGWKLLGTPRQDSDAVSNERVSEQLDELLKGSLEGTANIEYGSFIATLHNQSEFVITRIRAKILIRNADGSKLFERQYNAWSTSPQNRCVPFSSGKFSAWIGDYDGSYYRPADFEWDIVAVYGYKE